MSIFCSTRQLSLYVCAYLHRNMSISYVLIVMDLISRRDGGVL